MYSLYKDVANYIREAKEFSDKILKDLRYNNNKFEVLETLEKRLNNELKFPDKKILCADNKRTLKAHTNKLRTTLNSQNPVFSNLVYNNIEYVKFDKFVHRFDLKSISENTSPFDIESVIQDIVNEIYSQNLISTINELNYLISLERIYPNSKINNFFSKLYNSIHLTILKNLFSITLFSVVVLFTLIYVYGKISLIFETNSQLTISLALSGLTATFIGFGAVFIQLSFDNYKKYYGSYSKILLFKSIGKEIISVFVLTNFFALLSAVTNAKYRYEIFKSNYIIYTDLFLYLTIIFFFSFLIILGYKIKYVFDFSMSNRDLQNIITSIDYVDVKDAIHSSTSLDKTNLALKNFENNPIEIIIEVALNYIFQNNHKVAEIIIIDLTKHFQNLIITNNFTQKSYINSNIAIIYCRIMRKIYDAMHKNFYTELILSWYESLRLFNITASVHKVNARALNELMSMTDESFNPILKIKGANYLFEALNCYKESIFSHIFYNAPFWNDVQSDSISINRRRGQVFSNTRDYLNVLWGFSIAHLHNIILLCIDAPRNVSTEEMYLYLGLYKDFLTKNIGYNRSVILRYHYLNELANNSLNLYKTAFDRTDFNNITFETYKDNISQYSPFNVSIIASCLIYEYNETGSSLLDNYLSWFNHVNNKNKNEKFISELLRESIYLLSILLRHRESINQKIELSNFDLQQIKNIQIPVNKIINIYLSYNYDSSENSREIISAIHSIFWQSREFNLKDIILSDDDLASKIDEIISKTSWANTYINESIILPNINNAPSITKRVINFIRGLF